MPRTLMLGMDHGIEGPHAIAPDVVWASEDPRHVGVVCDQSLLTMDDHLLIPLNSATKWILSVGPSEILG